jgi:hypothetical protein
MSSVPHDLAAFLAAAYAGLDDDATVVPPLLSGSKPLEHRAPSYAYRDIYFGLGFFAGQGTVWRDDRVIQRRRPCRDQGSGQFSRNLQIPAPGAAGRERRAALSGTTPVEQDGMLYSNDAEGALDRFRGVETIARHDGTPLYELRYGGGMLR